MHELPITQEIIRIALETAEQEHAEKVKRINLVVGEQSGFVGETIKMYFDIAAEGTACDGAEIVIEAVKTKLKCPSCGELFERTAGSFACPTCGTDGNPTEIGKEFYIADIELLKQ
jgi:hydrogenase nickel incorporation protein HypA/HybF